MRKGMVRTICFIVVSLFICTSNHHSKAKKVIHPDTLYNINSFQTGDIILRESTGLISTLFKSFSLKEKKYTHAGFVLEENQILFVCHYIDAENTDFRKDKLKDFISASECSSFAVYRPIYSAAQSLSITKFITDDANSKIVFDEQFDLDNSRLYCTEWIYQCLKKSGFEVPVTELNGVKYIAPDNLYINNFTQRITAVDYESEI